MALYKVVYLDKVLRKDLRSIPKKDVLKILRRTEALSEDPRPKDAKKLTEGEEYRLRQGSYRILYVIADEVLIVEITHIAHRRNAYK